jgi:hypothetical protein
VGIYGFWTYLMRFLPEMRDGASRLALVAMMAVGSVMIVAMSSWLNAAALAGSAAVEQHLAETLEGYTSDLEQAHANALGALSLLPDIQRAGERFARLADDERSSGALTGTSGAGSVVQLLTQMSAQMRELESNIRSSQELVGTLFREGQEHLAAMRGLVSEAGAIAPRSNRFAEQAVALAGVVAALQQTSIAPSVARAAADLSGGFIAPVADGTTADLAGRQDQVMATIRTSVDGQSKALSDAAAEILAQPKVAERRYVPLSSAEAVLRYAGDFIPSWAGAISIDLLPGVLVAIMGIVQGAIRRGDEHLADADRITVADMFRSIELRDALLARTPPERQARAPTEPTGEEEARSHTAQRVPSAENVTPIALSERKRHDP